MINGGYKPVEGILSSSTLSCNHHAAFLLPSEARASANIRAAMRLDCEILHAYFPSVSSSS